MINDTDRVIKIGRVLEGNGGNELAGEVSVSEEAMEKKLGMDLLELLQCS